MKRLLILAFVLAGCSPVAAAVPSPTPAQTPLPTTSAIVFTPISTSAATLEGGRYHVTWQAAKCTLFDIEWGSTIGLLEHPVPRLLADMTVLASSGPAGEVVVYLPRGPGYLYTTTDCDWSVRLDAI